MRATAAESGDAGDVVQHPGLHHQAKSEHERRDVLSLSALAVVLPQVPRVPFSKTSNERAPADPGGEYPALGGDDR